MVKEFEAIEEDGIIKVKAIKEQKADGSIIMHVPSLSLIHNLVEKYKKEKDLKIK